MTLLPEQQAADHLGPLLAAAREAGLPVWNSITPDQVRRFLHTVSLADIKAADHATIDRSISLWNAEKKGKRWGPWWIAETILEEQDRRYQQQKQQERDDAEENPMAKNLAWKMLPGHLDAEFALKWRTKHNARQQQRIFAWASARRPGNMTIPKAYLLLAERVREVRARSKNEK